MLEFSMHVDPRDVLRSHSAMKKELFAEIEKAAKQAFPVLVRSIVDDLESKILRPRESEGKLAYAVASGEVFWDDDELIIGVGHIDTMDRIAPWWRLQDQGGPIAVKSVPGYFVDTSGKRVPFQSGATGASTSGAPPYFAKSKESLDLFIYDKGADSIMFIHADVKPKRYFEGGTENARSDIEALFTAALHKVLPQ